MKGEDTGIMQNMSRTNSDIHTYLYILSLPIAVPWDLQKKIATDPLSALYNQGNI